MPVRERSTVLVTGGSGFIGSHVVDRLLAAGHHPSIYDARPSPHHSPDVVPLVLGDVGDLDRLCAAVRGCDAVIHLAAAADVNEVLADPVEAERRNARGTLCVLEAARRSEIPRVVYASTIWVYSDTPAGCHAESLPLHPPAHLYTATKLAGELYCRSYGELYGLEHTILRFGIPYGPRARPAAVVPAFVTKALAGEPLTVAGDGSQSRRFVYVEDLAEGVVRALAPVAANRTYNLVGSEDVTIREIAETVRGVVGDVAIEHVPGRTGDFAGAPVSGERAASELGWRPTTPFAEGMRRYVAWHRGVSRPAPAAAPPQPSRRAAAVSLARRGALSLAWAAATALMIIGVATVAPLDEDMDAFDTFAGLLVLLLPVVLAGAFEWGEPRARHLRAALWSAASGCLTIALLPWPPFVHGLGHAHAVILVLFGLAAGLSAQLPGRRLPLRDWLGALGD